jgi:transcriptional regulator with XRE-family HTH domain
MHPRNMREARERLGWSQQKAAAELGVSQSYLSMLETGDRPLPANLRRKMVRTYKLPPTLFPVTRRHWTPRAVDPQSLAEELAALGYPGFAYLRRRKPGRNPAELLLTALAQDNLEARLFEALPWLLLKYWGLDRVWLAQQSRLHDLQNRLGFVITLAREAGHRASPANSARQAALESLEAALRPSLLAREEPLGQSTLSDVERAWLQEHRSEDAREWNLLTDWRPETLRYVA